MEVMPGNYPSAKSITEQSRHIVSSAQPLWSYLERTIVLKCKHY